jgi:hypothetical protein
MKRTHRPEPVTAIGRGANFRPLAPCRYCGAVSSYHADDPATGERVQACGTCSTPPSAVTGTADFHSWW